MREEPLLVISEGKPAPASGTLLKPCGFRCLYAGNPLTKVFLFFINW